MMMLTHIFPRKIQRSAGVIPAVLCLFGLSLFSPSLLAQELDKEAVARGAEVFRECRTCHSTDPGKHRTGPSLFGVYGANLGDAENYRYSRAFRRKKEEGLVWDDANLDAYLADPKGFIRGTKMRYDGLSDADRRADVIAYMKSVSP